MRKSVATAITGILLLGVAAGAQETTTYRAEIERRQKQVDKLDRQLDSLARHHARRLEYQQLIVAEPNLLAELGRVLVGRRGRVGEVHHVGNDAA